MQIVIDNIEQFKTFFDVIYDMSSDLVELQLFPDRMVCAMLDKTKTRFFHVEYKEDFFDEYIIDDVGSVVVFVDDFVKLLKSSNKKDTLILEVNDPYLTAKIVTDKGNSRVFEFVLPSDVVQSPTPPHIDLVAEFECDVGDLKQSVKDIELIGSDLFTFVCDGKLLTVMTDRDIATKYANTIDVDYLKEMDETVSASFTSDYVKQFLKFEKINKTVKLKIGQDMPVFYTFTDELMGVSINGMIAPRISSED